MRSDQDLQQRLQKKLKDVNSFNNHINNIKEKIEYFKDKDNKSKKKCINSKTLTTIIKSLDTFPVIAITSSSFTLSLTGIGLIAIPISTGTACAVSIGNKIIFEIIINKHNKHKKQYEKDQQTIESFNKLYRKFLQGNVIDKNENETLCNIFAEYVDETKKESFK